MSWVRYRDRQWVLDVCERLLRRTAEGVGEHAAHVCRSWADAVAACPPLDASLGAVRVAGAVLTQAAYEVGGALGGSVRRPEESMEASAVFAGSVAVLRGFESFDSSWVPFGRNFAALAAPLLPGDPVLTLVADGLSFDQALEASELLQV